MILLKPFKGFGLGKKFPFLWRIYDFIFRIFAPKKPFEILLNGSKFYVNPNEKTKYLRKAMQQYILEKEYEPETTKLVESIVKNGDTVLDIGASIGYFSMTLAKCVGESGMVLSFQPTKPGFDYLCRNKEINNYSQIKPFNLAAWDKNELVRMPMSSFATNTQWCNGVNISDFLEKNYEINKIDFIKMDIDGAEPWAIKGLIKIFKNNPNLKMICEYYPKYINASNGNPEEFLNILKEYFNLTIIDGDYGDGYWNYLCERKTSSV